MIRADAEQLVKQHIQIYDGYSVIHPDKARELLEDKINLLIRDPIRGKTYKGFFYYWNIIDYLDDNFKVKK